jgi:hypothetical protein
MGTHWRAQSNELIDVWKALEKVERRIFAEGASQIERDSAIEERESLIQREDDARTAQEQGARTVTLDQIRNWPPQILRHVAALGPADTSRSFLDLLGWGPVYCAENLPISGIRMDRFSHPLRSLDISAEQACRLGEEMLSYVDNLESKYAGSKPLPTPRTGSPWLRWIPWSRARIADQVSAAREAGLWLWFWGWLGCRIEAGE